MPLPAITVTRVDNPPPRVTETDTGRVYVTAIAERGPADLAVECRNLDDVIDTFGGRQTYSGLYDWADTFFHEGGASLMIARVVGPSPVRASKAFSDGSGTAVTVRAKEYGTFANSWTVGNVLSSGSFTFTVTGTDGDGSAFTETIGPYATVADAIAADPSDRVEFVLGTGLDPVTTTAGALSGGTDDHASVTNTERATARALFSEEYGPGQMADVDLTTTAGHSALMSSADATGRDALLDYADTSTAATILTALATDRADVNSESGLGYVNWVTIPPLAGTTSERSVPPSALVAGIMARNDGAGLSVNEPASGKYGRARWATGLTQVPWSTSDADDLADAGGNVIRDRLSTGVTVWGARTVADPDTSRWKYANNLRLYTAVRAQAIEITDELLNGKLNMQRIANVAGNLQGMLMAYFPDDLTPTEVGGPPSTAFNVDTSENNATTLEAGRSIFTLSLKMAGVAEDIQIRIARVAQTEAVA